MTSDRRSRGVRPLGEDHGVRIKRPDLVPDYVTCIPGLIDEILAAALPRVTCSSCGCLCKPLEVCPGCTSNRVTVERLLAEGTAPDASA